MSDDPHDRSFFEQMRECRDPYRRLGEAIHRIVGIQSSTLDIGCGIGLQTKRLIELGWPAVLGAEHSPVAVELREPGVDVVAFDLTRPAAENAQFHEPHGCVICTETAEHIPAWAADNIVANIAALATDTIVWSAAGPGQEWHGHINLQRPSYWLERFAALGWVLDEARTGALRDLMCATEAQHWRGSHNFCVLVPEAKYQPIRFTITTTMLNAEKWIGRCIASVRAQTYPHWRMLIVDAQSDDRSFELAKIAAGISDRIQIARPAQRLSALENSWAIWRALPKDDVIVWLDGDDWLATDHALAVLARRYAGPSKPWATYGQFMMATGEVGFAGAYRLGESARRSDWWRATHLKTFRAGLVQELDVEDLQRPNGEWCDLAIDRVVMYPLLELAHDHHVFVPQVLSVYNQQASYWANSTDADRQRELDEVVRLRDTPPKSPLTERPW